MKHISCSACRAHFGELLSKSTFDAASLAAQARAHLEECAECRREFELQQTAQQELQHLPRMTAPPNLRAAVRQQLESEPARASWMSAISGVLYAPQRLIWAGSTLAVFLLIAFLMRPERQSELLTPPAPRTNRTQIESQSQHQEKAPIEPPIDSHTPDDETRERQSPSAVSPPKKSQNKTPRKKQKPTFPAPKPPAATARETELPASVAEQAPPTTRAATPPEGPMERAAEEPKKPFVAPPPILQKNPADAASAPEPGISTTRENAAPAGGGFSPQAAPSMARMRALPTPLANTEVHWKQEVTSPADIAKAAIYAEPLSGISFADNADSKGAKERRRVWQGELQAGQSVTVAIDLQVTATSGKIRLEIENEETQKVLFSEPFTVNSQN